MAKEIEWELSDHTQFEFFGFRDTRFRWERLECLDSREERRREGAAVACT